MASFFVVGVFFYGDSEQQQNSGLEKKTISADGGETGVVEESFVCPPFFEKIPMEVVKRFIFHPSSTPF